VRGPAGLDGHLLCGQRAVEQVLHRHEQHALNSQSLEEYEVVSSEDVETHLVIYTY
jgi:hypothetical protein